MDKRFRLDTGCFIDMQENKVLTDRQAINLLNHLHEENIQLKSELQFRNCVGKSAQILTRSDWEDLE